MYFPRLGLVLGALVAAAFFACAVESSDAANPHGDGGLGGAPAAVAGSQGLGGGGGAGGEGESGELSCEASGVCGLRECAAVQLTGTHVEMCSPLTPHTNPPTSGPHYPSWAQFGIYDEPIPDGFLLHSLEHSAVALLYNCDVVQAAGGDCAQLVAELEQFYAEFELDPLCSASPHRLLVIPDPDLEVPFAATAWGYYLAGDCFDRERVTLFIRAHYGKNYENICSPGINPGAAGCAP